MNNTTKLAHIDRLTATIPTFQCIEGCTACCGPVVMSRLEWKRILQVAGRSEKELQRAAAESLQKGEHNCPLIDKEKGCCSVYAVRPTICRLFGTVDDPIMACPYAKAPAVLLTNDQSGALLQAVNALGT